MKHLSWILFAKQVMDVWQGPKYASTGGMSSTRNSIILHLVLTLYFFQHERNHSICYTATTYEVHTFKNKNKRKSLRDTFIYHFLLFSLFIRSCKFVIIETCSYDMMRTRGAHLSFKVYIRVRSKAVTSVL